MKILKWLNNNLLPVNYKIWKAGQDEVYDQLKNSLKPAWISMQHSIHSSMNLPFFSL